MELTWQAWTTLGLVGLTIFGLVRGIPADAVFLAALTALGVLQSLDPQHGFLADQGQALLGFANQGVLTVGALFVVAAGLQQTGALDRLGHWMLGRIRSERRAMLALAAPVMTLSAFLNNTAVVAMLVNLVGDWCRRNRVSPSRLLLPLSYLTILGGMCTLLGSSTNLVVSGLLVEHGQAPFSLFELAWVGVPLALLGMLYLRFVGRRLLPDRKDLLAQFDSSARQYLVNMRMTADCPLIGQQVEAAGLRRLPGLFLAEIVRGDRVITPVAPDEVLLAGDQLTFTGAVDTIVDLEKIPGLESVPDADDTPPHPLRAERRYCEAVVSNASPLLERTIRDANFRARYNAVVVAVHRGGTRLTGRVGDIEVRAGDTLLLQTGPNFVEAYRNDPAFLLVSSLDGVRTIRHERVGVSLALLVGLVAVLALGFLPTPIAALAFAGLSVATRCLSLADARRSIAWDVLLTIAASFALAHALEHTGAAPVLAHSLVALMQPFGPLGVLIAIYLLTSISTELITNNAAAVLIFPFAMSAAQELDADFRPFAVAVAIAASASFATPIGYQTNMLVYGPGGYRFADFVRVGAPMNVLLAVAAWLLIPRVWPF